MLVIIAQRTADGKEHIMRVVVKEREAVARVVVVVIAQHRIAQAAGFAHDGHAAIAQGDHLRQAAGLKLRGHQEHIRAGIDAVRQLVIHLEARGHAARILLLRPAEQVDIAAFAHAQYHQLYVFFHDLADHMIHQIQALLRGQAAHHADDGHAGIKRQAQTLLQGGLALGAAGQILGAVRGGDQGIGCRIILLHVNAVEHARERIAPCAQQAVQAFAVIGGLDFLGVAGADGGDLIRIDQRGFHEVGAAEALQLVVGKDVVGQLQHVLDLLDAEHALILQVMDGKHRADIMVKIRLIILDAQQRGHHAALPVVGVDDVGLEIQPGQRVQHGAAEEAKALVFVPAQAVDVIALEVILVIYKVEGNALALQRLDAAVLMPPAQLDVEVGYVAQLLAIFLGHHAVLGQDDAHIVPLAGKHGRKRAHHVGQSAGFDEGNAFAGSK